MTEKNPLDVSPIVQIQTPSFVSYNKRGRPKLENLITFSPEPKSIIITQIINQKKKEAHQENVTDLERTEDSEEAQWISNSGTPPKPIIFSHINNQKKTEAHQENIITDVKKAEDSEEAQLISNSETQIRPHHPLYYCDYADCSYTCRLTCNLIKHKRTHTEEKPYLCDQCSFRSNFINSLKVHKRIHTSERPYSCKHCNYRCNSSSNLKKHSLHRHPEVPKT